MDEKIIKLLRSIGLSRNETITFIDLIGHKESSARDVSNRTKLHRANIYEALKGLVDKGFASNVLQDDKRLYRSEHPKKIKEYLRHKEQEIDEILPTLISFAKEESTNENVTLMRGLFAARNALTSLLDLKSPIDVYGIPTEARTTLGEGFVDDLHRKRVRKRIPVRMIFNIYIENRLAKLNKLQYTDVRYSGLLHPGYAIINVCSDVVLTVLVKDNISTIEVRNKEIADSYRGYFNILWDCAKIYSQT